MVEELVDYMRDENLEAHTHCAVQVLGILKHLLEAQMFIISFNFQAQLPDQKYSKNTSPSGEVNELLQHDTKTKTR